MYILCPMFWCPGEQVPDGLLQPAQVQHGRAEEAAEEAEDQESHPLIDLESPRFQKDFWFTFLGKVMLSKCDFENTKKSASD